ncbi:hypothetical protein RclHR1_01190018 [Rhizophagus clarus]|uniref:Crinkler family protein n=1 Tax=Rhizophagus clarus TaxID=94130 RepID=A0A2Z6QA83_9GLOM|nr:hypothetical protein RclHR1_01190018 [Rhizophagus clarus]
MLSLNCLILSSERVLTEDIGENYYTDDNVEVKFPNFKVSHLKEKLFHRQIIKDITRSSEYIDLWKVDSRKVDEEKDNLKEFIVDDIKDKLGGVMMVDQKKLKSYFDKMSEEEEEGIHVFIVSTAIAPQANLSDGDIINILDPFIGEPPDPLHESLSDFNNIPDGLPNISIYLKFVDQPKKQIRFPTAVGTSGKGKTTFARRAYEKSDIYSKVVSSDVMDAVTECQEAGRTFRIACDDFPSTEFTENAELSFRKFLLFQALKYRLNESVRNFIKFSNMLEGRFAFESIFDVILHYIPCANKEIKFPLFIINIDETKALFESKNNDWLRDALRSLARVISHGYFLFVVLTGTHASELFDTVKSSNVKTEDISLPLLKSKHAEEVLLELANQGVVDRAKRINKLSEHTKYAIKLLGVVGRFLKAMIFQMSVIGSRLLIMTTPIILTNFTNVDYQRYFDHFKSNDNLALIPHLVAYSLFEWHVDRSDTIGINKKRKIEDLEKEELIFLEGNDYKRIKLPFLTLHEIYSNQNHDTLPSIKILDSLDNVISPNQNERLTISVLTFRLWAIHQRSISNNVSNPCSCLLS